MHQVIKTSTKYWFLVLNGHTIKIQINYCFSIIICKIIIEKQ